MNVKLRLLQAEDAKISYLWRNNPEIWKFTGSKPDKIITESIEKEWLKEVLKRKDEVRFAICTEENNQYIGNVQLTNITKNDAEFHIFIGEITYHNKGIGTSATKLILEYAKSILKLKNSYLYVDKLNVSAINSYIKAGFKQTNSDTEKLKFKKKLDL